MPRVSVGTWQRTYLLLLLLEIADITVQKVLILQRLLKGPQLSVGQEETSQQRMVEDIIASEELAVIKLDIFLTTTQCGGEHKTLVVINTSSCHLHKSNINRQKKVWTDINTVKSNITAATQELQDTLTTGLSL